MRRGRRLWGLLLPVLLAGGRGAGSGPARAEGDPEAWRPPFKRGEALLDSGSYESARLAFRESVDLVARQHVYPCEMLPRLHQLATRLWETSQDRPDLLRKAELASRDPSRFCGNNMVCPAAWCARTALVRGRILLALDEARVAREFLRKAVSGYVRLRTKDPDPEGGLPEEEVGSDPDFDPGAEEAEARALLAEAGERLGESSAGSDEDPD